MVSMKKKLKRANLLGLLAGIVILVLLNIIGGFVFRRFDLTAEKRYTLTQPTIDLLKEIEDPVTVRVYLDGDLPAYFIKLKNATRDMLEDLRAYNKNIEYEFVDPSASTNSKERKKFYTQLAQKGIISTEHDTKLDYWIFPGALITYHGKDLPVQLMQLQNGLSKEAMCYNSINNLEYEFSNTLRKFEVQQKPKIGFVQGHGELDTMQTYDIAHTLAEYYTVEMVTIDGQLASLLDRSTGSDGAAVSKPKYKAIIIAKPDSAFFDRDKFIIDQYLMNGGKILWCLDNVYVNIDSLQRNPATMAFPMGLNLEDMLFKYGVRYNSDLLMDLNATKIPVVTEMVNGKPMQDLKPWVFYPVILPTSKHPIVKNLNGIRMQFCNTLDTVGSNPDFKKYVLLHSSKYARIMNAPARISLNILGQEPDERQYTKRDLAVAVLSEGFFESNYLNRLPPAMDTSKVLNVKYKSVYTKQIFVSDGDVLRNDVLRKDVSKQMDKRDSLRIVPLEVDRYTGNQYGNKTFLLNAINYLCDDSGLISARAREVSIRLLDKKKIAKNKLRIQLTNVALPSIIILLFGVVQFFIRKRRFAK